MSQFKFTNAKVTDLPLPETGQQIFYDTIVQGFGLRVGAGGAKTYFAEGRLNGKKCRITIGRHGAFVPETARKRAKELLVDLGKGVDHNAVKAERRAKSATLSSVFEQFKEARNLRPKTLSVYTGAINRCFPDWLDKPVTDISKDMIEQRYSKLLNSTWARGTSGVAQAHQGMRTLRAVLNYAAAKFEDSDGKSILPENPVRRLSQLKIWQPVAIRENIIQPTQLKDWYEAVIKQDNDVMRDHLLLCLFSGLRRNEAARLKWSDIDLDAKTLKIPAENSKNHLEHRLPLSTFLYALLKVRSKIEKIDKDGKRNPYVFYGDGKHGHLIETRCNTKSVAKACGFTFLIHDLRRSFLTYGEMLDIPYFALKKLANHKTNDVTGRYIQADVERLRKPMQDITDFIMSKADIKLEDIKSERNANVIVMVR
jgi:integrase